MKKKRKLQEIKDARQTMNEKLEKKNNANFYAVVVFADEQERKEFFRRIHVPDTEDYITVEQVERLTE